MSDEPHPHSRSTFPTRFSFVLALALVATDATARAENDHEDFIDFLVGQHLLVEGHLVATDHFVKAPTSRSGMPTASPLPRMEFAIAVDRTWIGTADGPTIVITCLGAEQFPRHLLQPGARVVGWASRLSEDSGNLWGGVMVVDEDDSVFISQQNYGLEVPGVARRDHASLAQLDSLVNSRIDQSGPEPFSGADGVLIVRVGEAERNGDASYSLPCDSLGWAIPTSAPAPDRLVFTVSPGCYPPFIAPGDTMLVPIRTESAGATMHVIACPGTWLVKDGVALGFGTTIAGLGAAIGRNTSGLFVRPVQVLDPRFAPRNSAVQPSR